MHTGEAQTAGGRAGEGTTQGLSAALVRLGIHVERFKTGTPARLNGRTIDYSQTEMQPGDDDRSRFRFSPIACRSNNCPAGSRTPMPPCTT